MRTLMLTLLLASGCAHTPVPQDVMPRLSNFLSLAQDLEQDLGKLYNQLCAANPEIEPCVRAAIMGQQVNMAKGVAADAFEQLNVAIGGEAAK